MTTTTQRAIGIVVAAALALSVGACAAARPVIFASGTNWQVPLATPLENTELLVPVTIGGKGPYLFLLAPGATESFIDQAVAEELGLYRLSEGTFRGADGHHGFVFIYEILSMKLGDLELRHFRIAAPVQGSLVFQGRPVAGMIGGNLLTRTIVVDVDRDGGLVRLALVGHETAPASNATRVHGRLFSGDLLVPAHLDGRGVTLSVNLALRLTSVWRAMLRKLDRPDDAIGPMQLAVGEVDAGLVSVGPLVDERAMMAKSDGVLGLNALSHYGVRFDLDHANLWLTPRAVGLAAGAAARIARWGAQFAACGAACVTAIADGGRLIVRRADTAPRTAMEVVLEPIYGDGHAADTLLRVTLPAGVDKVSLEHAFTAQAGGWQVVDVSPFTVPCDAEHYVRGCFLLVPRSAP